MGTFVFKWPHAADEVYVTGTFDDWTKSEKLEKVGDVFQKEVTLKDSSTKILYKFVVNGDWVTDDHAPKETDDKGIENNVLKPEHIVQLAAPTADTMSTVTPQSTTAQLAGQVPLEKKTETTVPGTFPETPATELEKEFKVAPLPATEAALNPIQLAPGAAIPESVTSESLTSHVKLDKESYEKADTLPGITKETELPPVTKNLIPESSLPIATTTAHDVSINTVTPVSTTAALAASVPLEEPKVPEIVKESQEKAGVDPEASGISSEVREKENLEEELLKKVPEAPSTSEGTAGVGTEKSENDKTLVGAVTATVAGLGAAALATVAATKDKVLEQAGIATTQAQVVATEAAAQLPEPVKESLPVSVQNAIADSTKEEVRQEVSPEVPAEVKESIKEAGESPEAAANTVAVEEKKKVEAELLKEVKEVKAEKPIDEAESSSVKPETNGKDVATETKLAETKPAETTAVVPTEPVPPVTSTPVTSTPVKPSAPAPTASTPTSSKAPDSPAGASTAEKKKKNRLSSLFSKLKPKSHKDAKDAK